MKKVVIVPDSFKRDPLYRADMPRGGRGDPPTHAPVPGGENSGGRRRRRQCGRPFCRPWADQKERDCGTGGHILRRWKVFTAC